MPFLNDLMVKSLNDERWELTEPLRYETREGEIIVVPKGFITDFASVPRIPIAFFLAGNTAHKPAVVHDWLYSKEIASKGYFTRRESDRILREAMEDEGIWWWRRWLMWLGVRIGGGVCYKDDLPLSL